MDSTDFLMLLNGRNKEIPAAARFAFNQSHFSVGGVSKTFAELFTTVRASKAWDIVDGELVEYANNEPVLSANGLSVYEASTNLLTHNDGAYATYPVRGGDVGDGATFIAGFDNAISFADSPSAASFAYKTYSYAASTDYTFSFYVQMNDGGAPVVASGAGDASGDFVSVMYGAFQSASVEHVYSDIYRVVATADSSTSTNLNFGVAKYTGNSSRGFKVLGYQLEQSDFASTPIITDASTYTRAADLIIDNAAISSWFNDSEGTILATFNTNAKTGAPVAIEFSTGSSATKHAIYTDPVNTRAIAWTRESGVAQAVIISNDDPSDFLNYAYAYKANDFELVEGGASVGTDVAGTVPAGIVKLRVGNQNGGAAQLNGHVREIRYYNTRLSQANLEAITN